MICPITVRMSRSFTPMLVYRRSSTCLYDSRRPEIPLDSHLLLTDPCGRTVELTFENENAKIGCERSRASCESVVSRPALVWRLDQTAVFGS